MAIKDEQQERIYYARSVRLENTLRWIRHLAILHYWGGAFDPEHMRSLGNLAADGLSWQPGDKELPDFSESMNRAQEQAQKWADMMHKDIDKDYVGPEEAYNLLESDGA